jgi:hypothetical protein
VAPAVVPAAAVAAAAAAVVAVAAVVMHRCCQLQMQRFLTASLQLQLLPGVLAVTAELPNQQVIGKWDCPSFFAANQATALLNVDNTI